VSRRREQTWAATSVPDIRRQWCRALYDVIEQHSEGLLPHPGVPEGSRRLQRMQEKLAAAIRTTEADALAATELYWVSRDMVDVVMSSSGTLPEWTPALAAPAPHGFLCWAKPAGSVPYGRGVGYTVDVPWDAVWWWSRPDGLLQVSPASRLTKQRELLEPYGVMSPVWAADTLVLNPEAPRTDEAMGSPEASRYVSIVGAAWLLMGQASVSTRRTIGEDTTVRSTAEAGAARPRHESMVTLVDVRRPVSPTGDSERVGTKRDFDSRFWVSGHWRQTPCGPGRTQRKPVFIAPFLKGPEGAPIAGPKDRVHVLREITG
jgi:hypothetical protein